MTSNGSLPRSLVLTSFFRRMEDIDAIVRVMLSEVPLTVDMTFRGEPEQRVLLDFASVPARVRVNDTTRNGQIRVVVHADVMHDVLLGRLHGAVTVGRRQMLLRGSIADLASLIPLFEFSPLLYREHLADLGVDGSARPAGAASPKETTMQASEFTNPTPARDLPRAQRALHVGLNKAAYALGYLMGMLRHRFLRNMSLFEVLGAMSRGMEAATPPEKR